MCDCPASLAQRGFDGLHLRLPLRLYILVLPWTLAILVDFPPRVETRQARHRPCPAPGRFVLTTGEPVESLYSFPGQTLAASLPRRIGRGSSSESRYQS